MSVWRTFTKEDLILLPQAKEMAYTRSTSNIMSDVVKWGQMKLWLTYVNLLNYYLPPMASKDDRKVIILVIGASPGHSIPLINRMYPGIHSWHLYDTRYPQFEGIPKTTRTLGNARQAQIDKKRWLIDPDTTLGPSFKYYKDDPQYANVRWHNQFFEDREIDLWGQLNRDRPDIDIIFISDIRRFGPGTLIKQEGTSRTRKLKKDEIEQSILEDNLLQAKAVQIIRPIVASLKFKPPWSDTRGPAIVDLVSKTPSEITKDLETVGSGKAKTSVDWLVYLDGVIMFQPFIGNSSTETRLIVTDPDSVVKWRTLKFENQLFYHNRVSRIKFRFYNPFIPEALTGAQLPIDYPELLNNYDSAATTFTLGYYLDRGGIPKMYQQEMAAGLYRTAVMEFNKITGKVNTTDNRRLKIKRKVKATINRKKPVIFEGPELASDLGMADQPALVPAINVFPSSIIHITKPQQFRKIFPELIRDNFIFKAPDLSIPKILPFGVQMPAAILKMVGAETVPDLPGRPGGTIKVEIVEGPIPEPVSAPELAEKRKERRPPYWLTKFERAKVLGIRALQISKSAPVTVDVPPGMINPLDIAQLELEARRVPLFVVRTYPDSKVEEWPVSELALTPGEIAASLITGF